MKPIYLYITPFFPSPESWRGGYGYDAVKAIINDGRYEVRVIRTGNGGSSYEYGGVSVARLKRLGLPFGLFPMFLIGVNNLIFKRLIRKLGIDVARIAVCHTNVLPHNFYSFWLKRRNPTIKIISQVHCCYGIGLEAGRLGVLPGHASLLYLYYWYICRNLDGLVFVSERARQTFDCYYDGVPEGSVKDVRRKLLLGKFFPSLRGPKEYVVYNGIDMSLFSRKPRNASKDKFVIGCVANFQPLKGHMTLLKAIKKMGNKIPGLQVRMVGSGETLELCKKYVRDNDLNEIVSFEEEVDHRALPDYYRSLDLMVLPSRLEGFCCVYIEAWACGTPVIGCRGVSLEEALEKENASRWLIHPLDDGELADKILKFYENRWSQDMAIDLDINNVWARFLDEMEKL